MRLSVVLVFAIFSALVGANLDKHSDESCHECNNESLKHPSCMQKQCDCKKPPHKKDKVTLNSDLSDSNITDVEKASSSIIRINATTLYQSFVNAPRLHCLETDFLILFWPLPEQVDYYYVRYVSVGMSTIIRETPMTRCRYIALKDLEPDTIYSIELQGFIFKPKRQTQRVRSHPILISTRKEHVTVGRINHFWLSKFEFKEKKYSANVQWDGGR
uniref:Uncharacterized protein LOC114347957 n=1 Tax=Diabrotica virgifera virgifera TaxID=50390 RepID=A0A6P7H9S9_DIAVI